MSTIHKIHNNFFTEVFSQIANVRDFLQCALPEKLKKHIDFSKLSLDPTSYISEEYEGAFADIVAKTRTKAEDAAVDIYFLFEHKSFLDKKIFLQLLLYMLLKWRRDEKEGKPLRIIIPLVFYHGKSDWNLPTNFVDQFEVADELKRFMLNFEYVLFDTNPWNWQDESSQPLKENVFLLSAMLLMKAAFQNDLTLIRQVFDLWQKTGVVGETELITFLLIYIAETKDVPVKKLKTLLEESKIEGEEIMPTLAQRLRSEGKEEGERDGRLLDKQDVLIKLLSARFPLATEEIGFIRSIKKPEKLDDALMSVLTAQAKEDVLSILAAEPSLQN